MDEPSDVFLVKAGESLAGAESEYASGRYNNVANRCYYACYQAAVAALRAAGIWPPSGAAGQWGHGNLQAQFVGLLINRRKRYPGDLREVLVHGFSLRQTADYEDDHVSQVQAARALRPARRFVETIRATGGRLP